MSLGKSKQAPGDAGAETAAMPPRLRSEGWLRPAAFGLSLAAAALALRWALDPVLGIRQPFTPAYGAVAVAVWFGGWKAAAVTLVACHIGSTFWFVAPRGQWTWSLQEAVGSTTYYMIGAIIIYFGHTARATNQALNQALETLRQSDRRRMRFLAVLAHELRNPLATLSTAVDVIRSEHAGADQVAMMARIAQRQVGQLGHLIDDLLDVSRIDQGKIRLQRQRVAVSGVVAEAVTSTRLASQPDARRIRVELPPGDVLIDADPVRITQVLTNLLHNASKFSAPDTAIDLTVRCVAGEVVISVCDQGMGIPAECIDRIFEPFVQLDAPGDSGHGLGLGLPLVKTMVELHGGTVSVASEGAGRGAVFELRLPLARAA